MEKYIETTSTNYDLIIRLRFDQFIWNTNNNDFEKYNFQSINNDKNKILFNEYNIARSIKFFDIIKLRLDIEKANDYFHTQKRNLRKMARLLHIDRHPILD